MYRKWMDYQSGLEVIPVELPGNGCRSQEEYNYNFTDVAKQVSKEIFNYAQDRCIILYGHSMGAALAFLVCSQLEQKYRCEVQALIAAGRHAPDYDFKDRYHTSMGYERLAEELIRIGGTPEEFFQDPDILNFMLRRVWNDYKLNESFEYNNEIIKAQVFVHYGKTDEDASLNMVTGWKQLTENECTVKGFAGDHFFPLDPTLDYFQEILKLPVIVRE